MKGFKNSWIITEEGKIKGNLIIEDGLIKALGNDTADDLVELNEDLVVIPGFIDEHIHGAAGSDAMDGTIEDLKKIACALASEGTTGFLATTMTQSPENITKALKAVKEYRESNISDGAEILGVHLEGPFIAKEHVGAQPLEYVAEPKVETFKKYEEASGNNIRIVTLAPEVPGALDLIKYLKSRNVVASVGHTGSKYEDVRKAIEVGASNATHTYNAMKGIHHREVGTVGATFLFDELNAEIICDGIHVSAPAIKLLYKNKPHDKFTLITDAMRAKHMPDGDYELGGQPVIVKNNEARLHDGTLAGSVLKMNLAVKNVMKFLDLPLEEVVKYATINPARNLHVDDVMGSIKVGKRANLVVVDQDMNVHMTIRDGKVVYRKDI